jgi:quercetin dioxygenase-like cupin family protein
MEKIGYARLKEVEPVQAIPGHFRKTLTYNDDVMLCHFAINKGVTFDLHNHEAVQIGYVLSGKVTFFNEEGDLYTATAGDSYAFESWESHGCRVEEDCEYIECFTPARDEYKIKD